MPRFYFDLCMNGQVVADPDGLPLAEVSEAKVEAAIALAAMMVDALKQGNCRSMEITVRDGDRAPLARLSISIREDLS